MSTTDLASTMLFNLRYRQTQGRPPFDNDIVGIEYERDLYEMVPDVRLRAEGGLAERYGHYLVCCLAVKPHDPQFYSDLTVRLDGRVYSTEAWIGSKLRRQNLRLGSDLRFELAATLGISGVNRTIGREHQRQIDDHGNGHILFYVAPEVGVALEGLRNIELVLRFAHRSGAGGLLGHVEEGYNADVIGVRCSF